MLKILLKYSGAQKGTFLVGESIGISLRKYCPHTKTSNIQLHTTSNNPIPNTTNSQQPTTTNNPSPTTNKNNNEQQIVSATTGSNNFSRSRSLISWYVMSKTSKLPKSPFNGFRISWQSASINYFEVLEWTLPHTVTLTLTFPQFHSHPLTLSPPSHPHFSFYIQ